MTQVESSHNPLYRDTIATASTPSAPMPLTDEQKADAIIAMLGTQTQCHDLDSSFSFAFLPRHLPTPPMSRSGLVISFLLPSFVTYLLPLRHNSPLSSYFFVMPLVHYSLLGPVSWDDVVLLPLLGFLRSHPPYLLLIARTSILG